MKRGTNRVYRTRRFLGTIRPSKDRSLVSKPRRREEEEEVEEKVDEGVGRDIGRVVVCSVEAIGENKVE